MRKVEDKKILEHERNTIIKAMYYCNTFVLAPTRRETIRIIQCVMTVTNLMRVNLGANLKGISVNMSVIPNSSVSSGELLENRQPKDVLKCYEYIAAI